MSHGSILKQLILALCLMVIIPAQSQLEYLGKVFQHQDGVYGLGGTRSICFSPDKSNIYVSAEYSLAVFDYDETSGEINFVTAYKNNDNGMYGLNSAAGVVASPDGKFIYVSNFSGSGIAILKRDTETGLLEYIKFISDNDPGLDGLNGVFGLTIPENGICLYTAAAIDNDISVFHRDTITGDISLSQRISAYDEGGLVSPRAITISQDDRFVYVSSQTNDAISVFEINDTTGLLSFVQKIISGQEGTGSFFSPTSLAVSKDDDFLYVGCWSRLAIFERDEQTGQITQTDEFVNGENGVSGLDVVYSVTVSPDDQNIYTVSNYDTSFVCFSRNIQTGEFQFEQVYPFLNSWLSNSVYSNTAMLCDNSKVIATSYWELAFHVADRNQETGLLTYNAKIFNGMGADISGLRHATHCIYDDRDYVFVTTQYYGISMLERTGIANNLEFRDVVTAENTGIEKMDRLKQSTVSTDGKYLYTIAGFSRDVLLCFEIDRQNNSLLFVDSISGGAGGISGFEAANALVMTSDSANLYVTTGSGSRLLGFEYQADDGSLEFIQSLDFSGQVSGMQNISISNDDKYLFATTYWSSSSLLMLERDPETGMLTFKGNYRDIFPGQPSPNGLNVVDISFDKKNLYAVYAESDLLVNFEIDYEHDSLFVIEVFDEDTHPDIAGLQGINFVKVGKDGRFVYTSSPDQHVVSLFQRNPTDGKLTFIADYGEEENNWDGIDGIKWIDITEDNRNMYLISNVEESIASFRIALYLGLDIVACEGETVELDAGSGYQSYHWSTGSTNRRILVASAGTYYVETEDVNGFIERDTVLVEFNPRPLVNLADTLEICSGDSIYLDAGYMPDFSSYLWSTGDTSQILKVGSEGLYWVEVTNTLGCSGYDSVMVIVNELPELNLGEDIDLCIGDTVNLNAGGHDQILWNTGSTDSTIIVYSDGEYWVSVENQFGCYNSDTIVVSFHEYPQVDLGPDTVIAPDESLYLSGPTGYQMSYVWYNGFPFGSLVIDSSSFEQDTLMVWCEATSQFGCKDSDTVMVVLDTSWYSVDRRKRNSIACYPMPASEVIHLENAADIMKVKCVDIFGNMKFIQYPGSKSCEIRVDMLPSGIYFLEIADRNQKVQLKKILLK